VASIDRRRKKAPIKVKGPKITKPKPRKPRPEVVKPRKPPRKPVKPPRKPAKPPKKLPKGKRPKKPPIGTGRAPLKPPLPQIFGKNRHELLIRAGREIRARIDEANDHVVVELGLGHEATDRDDDSGFEYYQLIAQIEKMSPHDIYTLFRSPEL
jgi:hypothetical protein